MTWWTDRTHRTFQRPAGWRPPISYESYAYLVREVARLRDELHRVTVDRDHWYAVANYTPEELHEIHMRASQGRDPETGEWLWPDGLSTRN